MRNILTINKPFHDSADVWYKVGFYGLGLHLLYLGTLAQLNSSDAARRIGEMSASIGAIVLLWGSLCRIRKQWYDIRIPESVWISAWVMPFAILFLLIAAAVQPTNIYRKPMDFYPYLWVMIALGGVDEEEWAKVKTVFRLHALVGTMVFVGLLVLGYSWDYKDRSSFIADTAGMGGSYSEYGSPLMWSRQLMYSYPIMLLLLPEEKWFWRGVGVAASIGMATWAILAQFRSTLILGVGLTVVFSLYSWYKAKNVLRAQKYYAVLILAACAAGSWLLLTTSASPKASTMKLAYSQTVERLLDTSDAKSSSTKENSRFIEAAQYIERLTFLRAVAGDQGNWIDRFGVVMHVGHLRYIIYGGLPTVIVVWLLVYWQGWRGVVTSRRLSVLATASVAAMHSIQAIPAGMLNTLPGSAMLFICAGYCWHEMAAERAARQVHTGNHRALVRFGNSKPV